MKQYSYRLEGNGILDLFSGDDFEKGLELLGLRKNKKTLAITWSVIVENFKEDTDVTLKVSKKGEVVEYPLIYDVVYSSGYKEVVDIEGSTIDGTDLRVVITISTEN